MKAVALFALVACAAPAPIPAGRTPAAQAAAVAYQVAELWGASLDAVTWVHCDDVNGRYLTAQATVELCDTLLTAPHPSTALYYAAHEAAHAVTYQLAGIIDETSADEVAAIALIRLGLRDVVARQAAVWAADPDGAHHRWDGHPGFAYRAWLLERLAKEPAALHEMTIQWDRRLAEPQIDVGSHAVGAS